MPKTTSPNPAVDSQDLIHAKAAVYEGKEVWETLKGYEGRYEISSLGRLKSLNYAGQGREGILRPYTTSDGFTVVNLWPKGSDRPQAIPLLTLYQQLPQLTPKRQRRRSQRSQDN